MIEIRFDKTKDEVALLIWFLVDHSVQVIRVLKLIENSVNVTGLNIYNLIRI
jgi:hypothetical protein